MHFIQTVFLFSIILTLQLTNASPALGGLAPRDDETILGTGLTLVSFDDEFVQYVQPGEIITDCDPLEEECMSKRALVPRQDQSNCPQGTKYRSSICLRDDMALVRCAIPGAGRLSTVYLQCPAGTVCIQRGPSLMRRARCSAIIDLVLWYTPPDPNKEGIIPVHSKDNGTVSTVTNNYYNSDGRAIAVFDSLFTGQPGDIYLGDVHYSDAPESYNIDWGQTRSLDIGVKAGNSGGLKVVSFLSVP